MQKHALPGSPLRRTAIPHVFFIRSANANSGSSAKQAPVPQSATRTPARPKKSGAKVAVISPGLASTSSAAAHHPHAAPVDTAISTPATACFLGIPTELRCMIYDYLWTPKVDVYVDPTRLSHPNPVHPIFSVNFEVRLEATDNIARKRPVTVHIHGFAECFDFRTITRALEDLDKARYNKYFESRGAGQTKLHVHLHMDRQTNCRRHAFAPQRFADFLTCLTKLGLKAEYEYTFTEGPGYLRHPFDSKSIILQQLSKWVGSSPDTGDKRLVESEVRDMQLQGSG